eukprot:COSAG01_NODE_439_length_17034_cov_5.326484_3_plen_79_part_00
MPGADDPDGNDMDYVPHGMLVCSGIIMVIGGAYSYWGMHVYETHEGAPIQSLMIGLFCVLSPPLAIAGKFCHSKTIAA